MTILDDIVREKREEISSRKRRISPGGLREQEHFARATVSLAGALRAHPGFGIIAEIKRASPSAGIIRKDLDAGVAARSYERHGAAGISVLTDEKFFAGSLEDLRSVRASVRIPVLRKDFILDEYQITEAKAYGADAVLLIAALLERNHLADLAGAASACGLECLVELYETREIDILDFESMKLIGVNNRDLRSMEVDRTRTPAIAELLPSGCTVVSESGLTTALHLRTLAAAGVRAALIGEHFMKSADPGNALGALLAEVADATAR